MSNKLEELPRLAKWVGQLSSQFELTGKDKYRLDLTPSEAVTNIIQYAFSDDADHPINIECLKTGNSLQIRLVDDGQPFDPLQAPEVTRPNSLEDAEIGGLGIHFVRNLTDDWHYKQMEGQNRLILTFHLEDSTDSALESG